MQRAISTGKIQRGEIGMSKVGKDLEMLLGLKRIPGPPTLEGNQGVDISIIKIGGTFDKGPYTPTN